MSIRRSSAVLSLVCAAVTFWPALRATAAEPVAGPGGGFSALLVLTVGLALALAAALIALLVVWRRGKGLGLSRELLTALPQPRQLVDGQGRVRFANPAFGRLFGETERPAPELIAARCDDEGAKQALAQIAREAQSGRAGALDLPLKSGFWGRESGGGRLWDSLGRPAVHWCHVAAMPLGGRDGAVLWRIDEIEIQPVLASAMQAEQERLVELLGDAPIGVYSVDGDGRFLFVNQALADWLEVPADELTAGQVRLHDVIASALPAHCEPSDPFGDGATLAGEVTLRNGAGLGFQAFVAQDVIRDAAGGVARTRSVVRHLTREHDLAEALAQSERRFERFFQEAPIGIALIDARGVVTESNDALRELAGIAGEMAPGTSLFDLVDEEGRTALGAALEEVAAVQGTVLDRPPVEVHLGGGERVCAVVITRMGLAPDAGSGFIAHFIDTTEQKSLEAQFAQSQKMQAVGQLAGGIAHDFNNLLTAMIGFSDLLLLRHRPGDQSFADIMQIKQNANRAANLVRQLLAFSRQQTLRPRVLDVTNILAELSHLLRRLIGENIELKMIHGRDLGPVKADQGQLEQVIINLAVNSRDAMPEGGQLTIQTDNLTVDHEVKRKGEVMPPGDYTRVVVTDTGHGISAENIDRIFEPFFSTKEVGAGTGLGLSTVYGIVKQSGGFIFAESEVDVGTTFAIYLPHYVPSEAEVTASEAAVEESRDLSGIGTILLVEDEDGVRAFSARALRNKGYEVLEARSGEAALEVLADQAKPIDLLVTDVVMPKIDGPTLVRQVREERPSLKVIFISGYTEDAFRKRLDQDAGIHFLPKPFSLKQLAGKVKEVMREPAGGPPQAPAAADAGQASAG